MINLTILYLIGNRGADLMSSCPEGTVSPGWAGKGSFAETAGLPWVCELGYSQTGCALSPDGEGAIVS